MNSKFQYSLYIRFLSTLWILLVALSLPAADFSDVYITVLDKTTREPLIGVNIYTADHSFQTVTDLDGKAILKDLAFQDEVLFSYIGYKIKKLPIYQIRRQSGLILMEVEAITIQGAVVVGRRDDPIEEIPYPTDRITAEEIAFNNAQTTADALSQNGDVFVQKSQYGGGSPIIRGFEANKVLLVLDGVRMNNAIYRNGHLQNSITVDQAILDQIEVIYGPGSLLYGSDALGGVVHFRTKDPKLYFGKDPEKNHILETNWYGRFASASMEQSYHLDFNYGNNKWGWLFSSSYSKFGDLVSGSQRPAAYPDFGKRPYYVVTTENIDQVKEKTIVRNFDRQSTTGYGQVDMLTKLRFQPSEKVYFIGGFQYSTSTNVPRYDNLTDTMQVANKLKWSEWYYGPQQRLLTSLKMRLLNSTFFYDRSTMIGAFQDILEERLKRKYNTFQRTFGREKVRVYSFTADFDKFLSEDERNVFSYGFEANHNIVNSTAGKISITTQKRSGGEFTRYPSGGSTMTTYAGYGYYKWKSRDSSFVFNTGIRYTKVGLLATFLADDPIKWPFNQIESEQTDLTGSAGITLNSKNGWQFRLLGARAFRAPNLDDFAKVRPQNGFITTPNPNLQPEKSFNGEITLGKEFGKGKPSSFKMSGTLFYSFLKDVIVRIDTTVNGEPTLLTDDGLQTVQTNVNANEGKVFGISGNMLLKINEHWQLKSSLNYVKGENDFRNEIIDTIVPMAHIPPVYGQTSLSFRNKKIHLEVVARYHAAKAVEDYAISSITLVDGAYRINRLGSSDNLELTPVLYDEQGNVTFAGSYAWTTYNFYSSFALGSKLKLHLALENILDFHYRPFSSGVSAPGRNFIVALHGRF